MGNKIEMEITQLVEQNPTLLRLGLHLEFNDARHRVAAHLQRNIDRSKYIKYDADMINSIYCSSDSLQNERHKISPLGVKRCF